ncbi:Alpha/Beta hydrolase protein [Dipodascopsis uninucleata]
MLDHILGRPSQKIKKIQVIFIALCWILYLMKGPRHGPPIYRKLSKYLSKRASAWQIHVLTMTGLYILKNIDKILNLSSPEPLADIYNRNFFRASWILTALDAGFWTSMTVKPKSLRDIASIFFSLYYLVFAEQADEKVRKVRATATIEHLRVSWEKGTTKYLRLARKLTCPKVVKIQELDIPRPSNSPYKNKIDIIIYYDGNELLFKMSTKILLNFPGGGFVSMSPRHHDESLCSWARILKIPIVSINYKKAPEYPYPYSLDECYDAYIEIAKTKGKCIGLTGDSNIEIVILGDSAGGNFVAGTMLKLLSNGSSVQHPESLIMVYPALDLNYTSWMTDDQIRMLRHESTNELHSPALLERKQSTYKGMSNDTHPNEDVKKNFILPKSIESERYYHEDSGRHDTKMHPDTGTKPVIGTSLAMTSRVSYFSDKIITPEMLRAMVILYIGPNNRPDFITDYLLSPVNAPFELLAKFPKVYMICGEVDPLVDDTVLFAGRLREAKRGALLRRKALAMSNSTTLKQEESDFVEVMLIKGISHGFLQIPMFLPEGVAAIRRCAEWIQDSFYSADQSTMDNNIFKSTSQQLDSLDSDSEIDNYSSLDHSNNRSNIINKVFFSFMDILDLGWIFDRDNHIALDNNGSDDSTANSDFFGEYCEESDNDLIEFNPPSIKSCAKTMTSNPSPGNDDMYNKSAKSYDMADKVSNAINIIVPRSTSNVRKRKKSVYKDTSKLVLERELMDRRRSNLLRSLTTKLEPESSDFSSDQSTVN